MFLKKNTAEFWLVAGLGNPEKKYDNTRHNIGFAALDKLAEKYGCTLSKKKYDALYGECTIRGKRVLLVKPQTYMNLSGKALAPLSAFYKIPPERTLVLFDDISLDVGALRLRRKGSHGGHNGMKNIVQMMGTEDIPRLKIGVGNKPSPEYDLVSWVLGRFPKEQQKALEDGLDRAVGAVEETLSSGIDSAMNKYNS